MAEPKEPTESKEPTEPSEPKEPASIGMGDTADALRAVGPHFQHNLTALQRSVAPFFVMVIVAVLTIFEITQNDIFIVHDLHFFATNAFQQSISDPELSGIVVKSPRRFFVFGLAIAMWVLFVRFGFLYYRGILFKKSIRRVINRSEAPSVIKQMYTQMIKNAYLVDVLLNFFPPDDTKGDERGPGNLLVPALVIVGFLLFIGIGQYLTVIIMSSFAQIVGAVFFVFYASFYILFCKLLGGLKREEKERRDAGDNRFYGEVISWVFFVFMGLSVLINAYGIFQYGTESAHRTDAPPVFSYKIPLAAVYALHPALEIEEQGEGNSDSSGGEGTSQ